VGRVREMIRVDGRECWTLFDTGARNTYVVPAVARVLTTSEIPHPIRTALGGSVKETTRTALLQAEVEDHLVSTHALVVDEIGADEDGRPIEILFGALAMQQWGIRLVPDEEELGLSHISRRIRQIVMTPLVGAMAAESRYQGAKKRSRRATGII
jgi:hypothetical protein